MLEKLQYEFTKTVIKSKIIIGTGSVKDNEIGRFFILPEYQNKGYGKILLKELEDKIIQNNYENITFASSLGAVFFYKNCGYKYNDYKITPVEDGENLCYLEMIKAIKLMGYGHTSHNRSVYAAPAVAGLASTRLGHSATLHSHAIAPAHFAG